MVNMIKSNKVGMLIIGLFILVVGCESDLLELTPSNSQSLTRTVFMLTPESSSVQDSVFIGSSKTLYVGNVEDDKWSTILITMDNESAKSLPVCSSENEIDDLKNIQFELKSNEDLFSISDGDTTWYIEPSTLSVSMSSTNSWTEGSNLPDLPDFSVDENSTMIDSWILTENSLQISIIDSVKLLEWCNSQDQYIIIKYTPDLNTLAVDKRKLLEFYSSEEIISYRPQISFDYTELMAMEKSTNKFIIDTLTTGLSANVHIVNNAESEAWSRIYLLNVSDDLETNLDSSIVTYDLNYNEGAIINSEALNKEIEILKLTITLNDEIIDSIDVFNLSILDNSIISYSISDDLSNDNYSIIDTLGTELNLIFDQGEAFLDFGLDQCPDQLEDGNGGCLVLLADFDSTEFNCVFSEGAEVNTTCIYNSVGTEGNGILDWEDLAGEDSIPNGIWDDGEGEKWEDLGTDGCADEFEAGDGTCSETPNIEYFEGLDPNGDNFNIDPYEDDYHEVENPTGTENNGMWEVGEFYFDIGCDGIPQILDSLQNNNIYDDCEPFNDTGVDGTYTGLDEKGKYPERGEFPYNPLGSEANFSYQVGEPFDDFGVDNIKEGVEGDSISDNYNIDPNGDNLDGDGNGVIDWADINDDSIYNIQIEIGEYFYDFGNDGVSDADELFSESNFLNIGTGSNEGLNDYSLSKIATEATDYGMPSISTNDAMLWISNISPTENNQFELTFSIFAVEELKSLSFSLTHSLLDWVDTTFVSQSFASNNYTAKFIDDISVYEIDLLEGSSGLSMDYSNGITAQIDFVDSLSNISLSNFFIQNSNILLSSQYTQLILPIDVENSSIDEFGANLNIFGVKLEESQLLISINIYQSDESVIIPMSSLLQKYINGQYINYDGLEISLDGSKYNFSNIIFMNNAYLEIVHSQ